MKRSTFFLLLLSLSLLLGAGGGTRPPARIPVDGRERQTLGPRVAFVGDSVTLGANSTEYIGYAGMTCAKVPCLGGESRFIPYHLADAILDWEMVEADEPDVIILEFGAHAIVGCEHRLHQDGTKFKERVRDITILAKSTAPSVCLVEIPWMNWDPSILAWVFWYNQKINEVGTELDVPVAAAFSATANCGECISGDGFHPNDLGHQRIADAVLEACFP